VEIDMYERFYSSLTVRLCGVRGTAPTKEFQLELAKEALSNPAFRGVTIGDIAQWVGYSSRSTFTRAFGQRYGRPPRDFRPTTAKRR
jgi:AraC-like DNA-binding protein